MLTTFGVDTWAKRCQDRWRSTASASSAPRRVLRSLMATPTVRTCRLRRLRKDSEPTERPKGCQSDRRELQFQVRNVKLIQHYKAPKQVQQKLGGTRKAWWHKFEALSSGHCANARTFEAGLRGSRGDWQAVDRARLR